MISAGDFRKGITFEMDGDVYQIIDFHMLSQEKAQLSLGQKIKYYDWHDKG